VHRVGPQRCIRDRQRPRLPAADFAGRERQTPKQLADDGSEERPNLPANAERRVIYSSKKRDISGRYRSDRSF
jgi:hypothetical protein